LRLFRVTLYLALWGAIGPLVGIIAGHFLTRSSQHIQRVRDNRKQEYRELLTALTAAYMHILQYEGSGEDVRFSPVGNEAFRMLQDRIFIADDI
jgi:hypothetical protein